MVDRFTTEHRSRIMASVRSRDTGPERQVRRLSHGLGFRFSLRRQDLPGRPDLVFPRLKRAIFVHGCFWHRHAGCARATMPATNRSYWKEKFKRNVIRDANALRELKRLGWKPIVVWECELKRVNRLRGKIKRFLEAPMPKGPRPLKNAAHRKQMRQK